MIRISNAENAESFAFIRLGDKEELDFHAPASLLDKDFSLIDIFPCFADAIKFGAEIL